MGEWYWVLNKSMVALGGVLNHRRDHLSNKKQTGWKILSGLVEKGIPQVNGVEESKTKN